MVGCELWAEDTDTKRNSFRLGDFMRFLAISLQLN
jgi:hypothetical protein